MVKVENGKDFLYQWDVNQRLKLRGIKVGSEVHFESDGIDEALPVKVYEEKGNLYANIPNIHLQKSGYLRGYIQTGGGTVKQFLFTIKQRKKPADYVYTETETYTFETLEKRIKELEEFKDSITLSVKMCKEYAVLCNQILQDCQKIIKEMEE